MRYNGGMSANSAYEAFVMAMERVEQRLKRVTQALDAAGIPYAVVGGNAVAAWIARIDPAATRTTKDVDLLVRRDDLDRITGTLTALGFRREDLRGLVLFIDPDEPAVAPAFIWSGRARRSAHRMLTRRRTWQRRCANRARLRSWTWRRWCA